MDHREYEVSLEGTTPLIMHQDSVEWADEMEAWRKIAENKKNSKAGDDRFPAFRWLGSVYHLDDEFVGMPADNLMTMLMEGGAKVDTGKGRETFKKLTQSGVVIAEIQWPIETPSGLIPWPKVAELQAVKDFSEQAAMVRKFGFELFVKRAAVGSSKHIRVRPRFRTWKISGHVTVLEEKITTSVLEDILRTAGFYCGLGDWRPSSKRKPGRWGTFVPTIKEV